MRTRLLALSLVIAAAGIVGAWPHIGALWASPDRVQAGVPAAQDEPPPRSCRDLDRAWRELSLDFGGETAGVPVGRTFRLSDESLTVLVAVTGSDAAQRPTRFDFGAGSGVGVVIVSGGETAELYPFDPPAQTGTGLSGPQGQAIDRIDFCYRILLPAPPAPSDATEPIGAPDASPSPGTARTPQPTGTATAERYDLGAIASANALATDAAQTRATASALAVTATAASETQAAALAAGTATAAALATEETFDRATQTAQRSEAAATETAIAAQEIARSTAEAVETAAAATIAALQTLAAAPTPTPSPTPESILYQATSADEFNTWALPAGGWRVEGDVLVTDGSNPSEYVQPSYQVTDRANYAVEAEIRLIEHPPCDRNFGLILRGSESGYYAGGVDWRCDAAAALWSAAGKLTSAPISLDGEWHRYRVAVSGNHVTLALDGVVIAEADDADFPVGSQLALWSSGVSLEMRSFQVVALS